MILSTVAVLSVCTYRKCHTGHNAQLERLQAMCHAARATYPRTRVRLLCQGEDSSMEHAQPSPQEYYCRGAHTEAIKVIHMFIDLAQAAAVWRQHIGCSGNSVLVQVARENRISSVTTCNVFNKTDAYMPVSQHLHTWHLGGLQPRHNAAAQWQRCPVSHTHYHSKIKIISFSGNYTTAVPCLHACKPVEAE